MDQVSLDRLAARASAAGYSSIAHYALSLENDRERLMNELQGLVDVFLDAPALRAERLLYVLRCTHEWSSVRNAAVESGEWCRKCGAIRAEEKAA